MTREEQRLLRETREDVAVIKSKIETLGDHETRIRHLEGFKERFPSVAAGALVLSIVGIGITVIPHI